MADKQETDQPIEQASNNKQSNPSVNYWLSFFFGAIIASVIIVSILPSLANQVKIFIKVIGWITIILATLFLFVTIFKEGLFKFFLGFSQTDFKDIQQSGESLFDNYQNKEWTAAKGDLKILGKKGLAWYSWRSYRSWVIQLFQILFLGFVSLFGSMLLYNQNQLFEKQNAKIDEQTKLLEKQNEKIDAQIQLEESSRRGNLVVMMSNIMDKVDEELEKDWNKDSIRNLSPQLIGRIAALSHAFRPYKIWQDDTFIGPYSPEKGQLLIALVKSELDYLTYRNIFTESIFELAHLRGAKLKNANLKGANLRGANLIYADLQGADLRNVDLIGAEMDDVNLSNANLGGAVLLSADLRFANLKSANLSNAFLNSVDFKNADLRNISLDYSIVYKKNWIENLKSKSILGIKQINRTWFVDTIPQKGHNNRNIYRIKPKS